MESVSSCLLCAESEDPVAGKHLWADRWSLSRQRT